jgi:hypothetical protein
MTAIIRTCQTHMMLELIGALRTGHEDSFMNDHALRTSLQVALESG